MVLVAATAAGLGMERFTLAPEISDWPGMLALSTAQLVAGGIRLGLVAVVPVLATWTLALAALQLRQPRPRLRRLTRQPGFVACVTASAALAVCGLSVLPPLAAGNQFIQFRLLRLSSYSAEVSFAVAGAWLALALGGRWRPEPTWPDRLGRALGASWIAANAVAWMRLCLV